MDKQLIIAVSRECGSGGHIVAEILAKQYGLPLLNKSLLQEMCEEKNISHENLEQFDEAPKKKFLSRTVKGFNNSPEEIIAQMQFEFMRKKAERGESFVVVGRCAESILKGNPALISVFVLADKEFKLERISEEHGITLEEAEIVNRRIDKKRKYYHNTYSDVKWGDSRNYDLCINCSKLGIEGTAEVVKEYIDKKLSK